MINVGYYGTIPQWNLPKFCSSLNVECSNNCSKDSSKDSLNECSITLEDVLKLYIDIKRFSNNLPYILGLTEQKLKILYNKYANLVESFKEIDEFIAETSTTQPDKELEEKYNNFMTSLI